VGIRNCIECGKVCIENPSKLCPDCYAEEEQNEHAVGEFLRDHGKAPIHEIHLATGVKEKTIVRMLKSGRLFAEGMVGYPCESCHDIIYEGKLCVKCMSGFIGQVREAQANDEKRAQEEQLQQRGVRMYTKEDDKRR